MADQTSTFHGPSNTDAVPNIDVAVLPDLPTAPDNMKTALNVDPQFWADHSDNCRR
jgi:putative spermidine/putrescine transport system substrate-binding protein